jgi:hypothetical protein
MTDSDLKPPIPATLASRPLKGGLAYPWVNVELADGGADYRSTHYARYEQAWTQCLCQSCGNPTGGRAVLVCGPRQILNHRFDEPPVCPPCAMYASRACPMVAGRTEIYPDRPKVAAGHRGSKCTDPSCGCAGWIDTDPEHSADQGGQRALPWYACWIRPGDYTVTAHEITTRCSDLGCEHQRTIVNGAILNVAPLKIMLISEPGTGRAWRRLTAPEAAEHATSVLAAFEEATATS